MQGGSSLIWDKDFCLYCYLGQQKRGKSPPYEFNSAKSSRYWLLMTAKI